MQKDRTDGFRKSVLQKGLPEIEAAIGKTEFKNLVKYPLQMNTKNAGRITKITDKIAKSVTWKSVLAGSAAIYIAQSFAKETVGGEIFGEFTGMEETDQNLGFPMAKAYELGMMDLFDELVAARREVLTEKTFWEKLKAKFPFVGAGEGLDTYREEGNVAVDAWEKIGAEKRDRLENGTTVADQIRKGHEERMQGERDNIDYFNNERLRIEEIIAENERLAAEEDAALREEERAARRAEDKAEAARRREEAKKVRDENAAFWAAEREKTRVREAQVRKELAEFWRVYHEESRKLAAEEIPSQLNFGLI